MWANRYWYNFWNPCVTASWYASNLSITDTRKPCVIWYAWCPHKNWYIPALSSMRKKACAFLSGVIDPDLNLSRDNRKTCQEFFLRSAATSSIITFFRPSFEYKSGEPNNRMEQRHIHINCYDCCFFFFSLIDENLCSPRFRVNIVGTARNVFFPRIEVWD